MLLYSVLQEVATTINILLNQHDREDPDTPHQAMVLMQTIRDLNPAAHFKEIYCAVNQGEICETYTSATYPYTYG